MYKELKYPPYAFWEITEQCNHNCIHCFNYWRTSTCTAQIESMDYYVNLATSISSQKPLRVIITGGEPLLLLDVLKLVIPIFEKNNINVSINTNAALMNNEIIDYLTSHKISLFISYPSCKEQEFDLIVDRKGAFNNVNNALALLCKSNVRWAINMVISKVNLHSIYDTAKFLQQKYSINSINITRASTPMNARNEFNKYKLTLDDFQYYVSECLKINKELGLPIKSSIPITPCSIDNEDAFKLLCLDISCGAGKTSYIVSSNGDVRACTRDDEVFGNMLLDNFESIWKKLQKWRDSAAYIPKECAKCSYVGRCLGGCRMDGKISNGHIDSIDDYSIPQRRHCYKKSITNKLQVHLNDLIETKQLAYLDDGDGVRVSFGGKYVFCTKEFANFLKEHKKFIVSDFTKYFDVECEEANEILSTMIGKGLINVHYHKESL